MNPLSRSLALSLALALALSLALALALALALSLALSLALALALALALSRSPLTSPRLLLLRPLSQTNGCSHERHYALIDIEPSREDIWFYRLTREPPNLILYSVRQIFFFFWFGYFY